MRTGQNRWAELFLFLSILPGALVRFIPTFLTGSPINDGGMFYVMIEDLKASHFLLPAFTSYNHLNIPFAYPPLSFYIGGFFSLLGISTFNVIRWLPPLVSTLAIPAFYWMASLMLDSRTKASLATLAYALAPRSFSWYVMGGGLSRTFGVLFLLLACASAWRLFTKPSAKYIFLTMLFGAGSVLSHPETGIHAAAACGLIWFFKGRTAHGLRDAALVALGVFLLSSPWWGAVVALHGFGPFQSALNTGGRDAFSWLSALTLTEERFIALVALLGVLGFVLLCMRRDLFLPIWVVLPFIVEPRSATAISLFPLAMLAGIGLTDFVIPKLAAFTSGTKNEARDWTLIFSDHLVVRITLACIMTLTLIGALTYDLTLTNYIVFAEGRTAMQWVKENVPASASFLVLTDRPDPFSDPVAEWFPVISDRTSQNTLQGREWLLGKGFMRFYDGLGDLKNCLDKTPACLVDWASAYKVDFNYVYLEKPKKESTLLANLRQDSNYSRVYENDEAVIFERK